MSDNTDKLVVLNGTLREQGSLKVRSRARFPARLHPERVPPLYGLLSSWLSGDFGDDWRGSPRTRVNKASLNSSRAKKETIQVLEHAEEFRQRVCVGLETATFEQKRQLIKLLIGRIVVTSLPVALFPICRRDRTSLLSWIPIAGSTSLMASGLFERSVATGRSRSTERVGCGKYVRGSPEPSVPYPKR